MWMHQQGTPIYITAPNNQIKSKIVAVGPADTMGSILSQCKDSPNGVPSIDPESPRSEHEDIPVAAAVAGTHAYTFATGTPGMGPKVEKDSRPELGSGEDQEEGLQPLEDLVPVTLQDTMNEYMEGMDGSFDKDNFRSNVTNTMFNLMSGMHFEAKLSLPVDIVVRCMANMLVNWTKGTDVGVLIRKACESTTSQIRDRLDIMMHVEFRTALDKLQELMRHLVILHGSQQSDVALRETFCTDCRTCYEAANKAFNSGLDDLDKILCVKVACAAIVMKDINDDPSSKTGAKLIRSSLGCQLQKLWDGVDKIREDIASILGEAGMSEKGKSLASYLEASESQEEAKELRAFLKNCPCKGGAKMTQRDFAAGSDPTFTDKDVSNFLHSRCAPGKMQHIRQQWEKKLTEAPGTPRTARDRMLNNMDSRKDRVRGAIGVLVQAEAFAAAKQLPPIAPEFLGATHLHIGNLLRTGIFGEAKRIEQFEELRKQEHPHAFSARELYVVAGFLGEPYEKPDGKLLFASPFKSISNE
jgi:hypothetical protein